MNFFTWFDNFLLDSVFEKFAHRFQRLTGKNCFFLGKQCCFVAFIVVIISCFLEFTLVNFVFDLMFSVFMLALVSFFQLMELIILKSAETRTVNPLRLLFFQHRIWALICIIIFAILITPIAIIMIKLITIVIWMKFSGIVLLWMALYFGSCTPLPPGKSKVRVWLEAVKKFFSPVPPEPEPVTVQVRV